MKEVILLFGTHKGAFLLQSDRTRTQWKLNGPYLKGLPVEYLMADQRSELTFFASATNPSYGPQLYRSTDMGQTWQPTASSPRFADGRGQTVEKIWVIEPGREQEPETLYAGVAPATLFVSRDHGTHWEEVRVLTDHPTRKNWFPGNGGLCLHSILIDPLNPARIWVAISAAGVFFTEDAGQTWTARNQGIRAEFLPNQYPDVGQCVHKVAAHPLRPDVIFLQNHGGVCRTQDGDQSWQTIETQLPAVFGFPILVHPQEPETVYMIPFISAEERYVPEGKLAVYRSHDAGRQWQCLSKGLPTCAWVTVFRQALTADTLGPCGVYFGTSTGQVFGSRDSGDSWSLLADYLPPILSVRACVT